MRTVLIQAPLNRYPRCRLSRPLVVALAEGHLDNINPSTAQKSPSLTLFLCPSVMSFLFSSDLPFPPSRPSKQEWTQSLFILRLCLYNVWYPGRKEKAKPAVSLIVNVAVSFRKK